MNSRLFRALIAPLALLALLPVSAGAKPAETPVAETDLARHIGTLAGDAFEGRSPGSEGEDRTIAYIVGEFAAAGLRPAPGSATPWLQPVPLEEVQATGGSAAFRVKGRDFAIEDDGIILTGAEPVVALTDLPALFVGYGVDGDGRVNADVAGKLAIMLMDNAPFGTNLPRYRDRRQMLADAGAAAVLVVASEAFPWAQLRTAVGARSTRLAGAPKPAPITGFLSLEAADALLTQAGFPSDTALAAARAPDFAAIALPVTASLNATADRRVYASHNVVARLPGANPDGKALLFLAHWDHLGLCRPEGEADRICNGAVDNASGIAVLIEVARHLAAGPPLDRDVWFMATTAEEKGLLGASWFADHPPLPLDAITVALNIDTIAISPRGMPVATIGRGRPAYDAAIRTVAARLGRTIDADGEADAFVQRQDGWALGAKHVPSLMVGGSFSDMPLLEAFLAGGYHAPGDEMSEQVPLGGAAEDADLHIALGRYFASRKAWAGDK